MNVHVMTYREAMRSAEYRYMRAVLAACGENVSAAARVAGIYRTHVYKILRRHGDRDTHAHAHRGAWERDIPREWWAQ